MSGLADLGRLLRTARYVRPAQGIAALQHAVSPGFRPVRPPGGTPEWAAGEPPAPFLPGPPHARVSCGDGRVRLELLNRAIEFRGGIAWDHLAEGPLWAYHLHQFDWARTRALGPEVTARWMLDWIEHHPRGIGWDPHPISLRILSWGKLLRTPGAVALSPEADDRIRESLAMQVETLVRNLEVRLQANHLFTNLLAVVFGGLLFEGPAADRWLGAADDLQRELGRQILRDGMHEERTPGYHLLLLEEVLDLLNLARAGRSRLSDDFTSALADCAARMLGAARVVSHPDGEIALFADSAIGVSHPPQRLAEYARTLGIEPRGPERSGLLEAGGFVALSSRELHVIAKVVGPAPAHQPGHSHCDALAFELSVGEQRVVTDTGVFEYVPGPLRDASRATRSHATVEVGGRDQAEIWAAHRVGGRPTVDVVDVDPDRRVEATCRGYATPDTLHRRIYEIGDGALSIEDRIEGRDRPVCLVLPIAPDLRARLTGEGGAERHLEVELAGGRTLRVALPGAGELCWELERTDYFPEFHKRLERWSLVGRSREGGAPFRSGRWHFRISPTGPSR